jgi:hypothetical protein
MIGAISPSLVAWTRTGNSRIWKRRIDSLEQVNEKRAERWMRRFEVISWMVFAAFWSAMITLAATGVLHHH